MPIIFPPSPSFSLGPTDDPNPEMDPKARRWAMLCHVVGFLVFGALTAFLIIWLIKWIVENRQHPFVEDQGKEAVNFQLTMLLILLALPLTCIGIVLVPVVPIVDFILVVIAAIKADDGYHYRYPYPLIVRFIK